MLKHYEYKSEFEKRSFRKKVNKIFSDLLFRLYQNKLIRKLRLDRSEFLREHIRCHSNKKNRHNLKSTIPKDPSLELYSVSFLDSIANEDAQKFKARLFKVVSRFKGGFLQKEPARELERAFAKFETSYKTFSWGEIYYSDTKNDDELELIDGVSFSYVKGAQSHFILIYTVYPSKKFKKAFKDSLKQDNSDKSEIIFNSFNRMIKTKRLFNSISTGIKPRGYWTEKTLNELNFQFKNKIAASLKFGYFNYLKKNLFPRIISIEYDPNSFSGYKDEFFQIFDHNLPGEIFNYNQEYFTLKFPDYSRQSSNGLEFMYPIKSNDQKRKDQFNSISYKSEEYIKAIAPFWLLTNVSAHSKIKIVKLRKRTYQYINSKKVSLFLRKTLRLKNQLSIDWINFERLREDFSETFLKQELKAHGIPDALNEPWVKGVQPDEFKESLIGNTKYISADIKSTYEKLLVLFNQVSSDNIFKANIKLQRLLFWIAIIGVILALYGSNSEWVNSWIEYYLNSWGISFPKPPNLNNQLPQHTI